MQLTTKQPATVKEVEKSQAVRLLDVAIFGPAMILSAMNKNPPGWMRLVMLGVGVGTVLYNAKNYFANVNQSNIAGLCNCNGNKSCNCNCNGKCNQCRMKY